ncbi:MAG: homoserine dehydrogenase, partial [Anaerolineae bacterium]|nr:homoserine dehydrogenase [Anaerolineae bacterium]
PTLTLGLNALAGCDVTEIRGILNGTTNYILTEMEAGNPYSAVLEQAQALGYAEADPTADVEGFDALSKVLILANTLMGAHLTVEDIPCIGIMALTLDDIHRAKAENKRWKLIGSVKNDNGKIYGRVEPMLLPLTDPLASISGVTNAITFSTDLLGSITLIGPGAGQMPTGFAVLSDLLQIHRRG